MPTQRNLLGSGCPPLQAIASVGIPTLSFNASGSSIANGPKIQSDFVICTLASGSQGAVLPKDSSGAVNLADTIIFVNHSTVTALIFPGTTGGNIAGGTTGATFPVPTLKTAWFLYIGSDQWAASVSA